MWMPTGSIDGMCAIIGLLPDKRTGVYILENLDHAELRHGLMYDALDQYLGGPQRDWSAEVRALFDGMRRPGGGGRGGTVASRTPTKPSLALDRYAGTYVDSAYGTIQVTSANGALRAKVATDPEAELVPVNYETFRTTPAPPASPAALTFLLDGTGGVSGVRVSGVTFNRVRATRR
jgi:hypothetical protein